jgi:YD repeat-containing protein
MAMPPLRLLSILAAVVVAGCAGSLTGGDAEEVVSAHAPVASVVDPSGRMRGYEMNRRVDDVVKLDGLDVRRSVEYGFDYDRGTTLQRTYDAEGRLIEEKLLPSRALRATEREEARLRELVAGHPTLGPVMRRPGLLVHAGGFVVYRPGDPYCSAGSRCIRFIVSAGDGSEQVIHAVVDLVSDRVVYPHYPDPSGQYLKEKGNETR